MQKKPRILIYDPYLGELGGGERVVFAMAEAALKMGSVDIYGPAEIQESRLDRLGINPSVSTEVCSVGTYPSLSRGYDVAIFVTNELPPPSYASTNLLLVQFPFTSYSSPLNPRRRLIEVRNLQTYSQLLTYSRYVQFWVAKRWRKRAKVLYPPVTLNSSMNISEKSKQILSVGRFFEGEHSKRQDVLIDAYMMLSTKVRREWSLYLAGGVHGPKGAEYFERVKAKIQPGSNIHLVPNASAKKLEKLYQDSAIYWHAAGYGREEDQPGNAEHFGMTTVEAMSYGCVPMAYRDGGQPEILGVGNGLLWEDIDDLIVATEGVISSPGELDNLSQEARLSSMRFSANVFESEFSELLIRSLH